MLSKKMCLFLSIFLFFLLFTNVHAVSIDYDVSDTNITPGDSFSIDVNASDAAIMGDEVIAFGFDIQNSDTSIATYDSYTIGSSFNYDDSTFFPDNDVAGSMGTAPGITKNKFKLATLNFTANKAGSVSDLGIVSDLTNPNQGLQYLMAGQKDITSSIKLLVNEEGSAPIPEPTTWLLLSTGLVGLFGFGRKKFFNQNS